MKALGQVAFLAGLVLGSSLQAQVGDWPHRLEFFRGFLKARAAGRSQEAERLYLRAARLPRGTPEVQRRVLERLNQFRMYAGVVPVLYHPLVAKAAQAHAGYLERNTRGAALSLQQAHGENTGRPGFTGATVGERLKHQGMDGGGCTEAVTSEVDPEGAVEILMNSVYHRSGLLRQEARYAAFGVTTQAVLDLYWEEDSLDEIELVTYPGPDQQEVPPRFPGGETPDPLPGVEYPVGSPLSLGGSGSAPEVHQVQLSGGKAGSVPVQILTPGNAPSGRLLGDYCYLMPMRPLEAKTVYRVRVEMTLAGRRQTREWSFRTGTQVPGEQYARVVSLVMDKQVLVPGQPIRYRAEVEASHPKELQLRWVVDGKVQQDGLSRDFSWTAEVGQHRIEILAYYPQRPGALMQKEFSVFVPGEGAEQGETPSEFQLDPPPPWRKGTEVTLRASPPPGARDCRYRFLVDERPLSEGPEGQGSWTSDGRLPHAFRVEIRFAGGSVTRFLEVQGR